MAHRLAGSIFSLSKIGGATFRASLYLNSRSVLQHPTRLPRVSPYSTSTSQSQPPPAKDSWLAVLQRQCKPTLGSVAFALLGVGLSYAYNLKSDSGPEAVELDSVVPASRDSTVLKPSGMRIIGYDELEKHRKLESAWIAVNGKVYDVTDFLPKHPGGAGIILANAGQDSTAAYARFHPERFLSTVLDSEAYIGDLDLDSIPKEKVQETDEEQRIRIAQSTKPPLAAMINLNDFEDVAKQVLSDVAWGYYSSVAEEGSSFNNNLSSYSRYEFRPRCLQKTEKADCATEFFGIPTPLPIFVSPCAKVGLGHPEGEVSIARGAGRAGIIQVLSNLATNSPADVSAVRQDGQTHFFQVYIHPNWKKSEVDIKGAEDLGYKAVFLTVDTTHLGKREADMRASALAVGGDESQLGVARQMGSFYDENLGWDVVPWLKSVTKLPVVLKGIQCVEDVETAYEHGVAGVVLSNHGGRQLAYAPASIDILYELRQRRPDILENMEIYIDGGIRRGTDVVKALCLGAKGVGLGRPFLYANSAYGEDGVARVVSVMKDEVVRTMRLLGVSKVEDLRPEMVVRRN